MVSRQKRCTICATFNALRQYFYAGHDAAPRSHTRPSCAPPPQRGKLLHQKAISDIGSFLMPISPVIKKW